MTASLKKLLKKNPLKFFIICKKHKKHVYIRTSATTSHAENILLSHSKNNLGVYNTAIKNQKV